MAKIYTVVKDGETVKELKTLTAAKKLADEQGGEVLCDGEIVYYSLLEFQNCLLGSIGQFTNCSVDCLELLALADLGDQPRTGNTDQGDGEVGEHAYNGLNNDSVHSLLPSPFNARTAK